MSQTVFRSKIDSWLVALLGLSLLAALAATLTAAASVDDPAVWIAVGAVLASGGLVAWLFVSTRYELDERQLTARSGPFRFRVDLAAIESVEPSRNPLSSPALSLDRLAIRHAGGKLLLVSPAEHDRFLAALARAAPELERRGDALRRRA